MCGQVGFPDDAHIYSLDCIYNLKQAAGVYTMMQQLILYNKAHSAVPRTRLRIKT